MKIISQLVFTIVILGACTQKNLRVKTHETSFQGVVTQSLQFKKNNQKNMIVCYSEILNHKIIGLSCQNDTGLPLFSGGINEKEFQLEIINRFLFSIKPETVLNYIKISLFSEFLIENKSNYSINIDKRDKKTQIQDNELKLSVELLVL